MRSGPVSALFFLFLSACFPARTAAQTASSAFPDKPRGPSTSSAPPIASLRDQLTNPPEANNIQLPPQQTENALKSARPPTAQACCVHITILRSPQDLDTKALLPIPKDFASNMPTIRPMPPYPQDLPAPAVIRVIPPRAMNSLPYASPEDSPRPFPSSKP